MIISVFSGQTQADEFRQGLNFILAPSPSFAAGNSINGSL
ncbi:hypothetical protein GCM10011409_18220 [Lentibacillus populi]|uniref:Uncharacterized protein n=1 Tax=Lentibacillus populi TaxID=1827502 RepID=A0A9W5TXB0_9BACI|nr:hypothetical protein GCM10011409_18220 [Lentibacillus populi]